MADNSSTTSALCPTPPCIRVVKPGSCILDDDERALRDRIALRLAGRLSVRDMAPLDTSVVSQEAEVVGYLYFVPIGSTRQVSLDELDDRPTVIIWRGNPPRDLPARAGLVNICMGDPSALSRIIGFFHQVLPSKSIVGEVSRPGGKSRAVLGENGVDWVRLAVDVRLFAFPELSERGIGHYVLPHLRAILASGFSSSPSLLVDSVQCVPETVKDLAEAYRCRVISLDEARNERFDIVHLPDPVTILPGYDSPLRCRPESRVTSALFYDLIPLRVPDQHLDRWDPRSRSVYLNRLAQVGVHDCHLFAISECTRRDLIELLSVEPTRVTTILAGQNYNVKRNYGPQGGRAAAVTKRRHGIRHPFF